jgi:uncharacterized protein with FMN-binding domain
LRRATAVVLGTVTGAGLLVGAKVGNASIAASGGATATAVSGPDGATAIPLPGGSTGGSTTAVAPSASPHLSTKPSPTSGLPTPRPTKATPKPTATPTPKPTPSGPRDGTYKASSSDRYGTLTLTVTISGQRMNAITAAYDSGSPQYCTTKACPILRSEALAAQSANIATVSGATYTSDAYKAALAAVLKSAG